MKKDLNFEINILPILDILSVLICFLLLTAVWIQVGTLSTQQALGDNTISEKQNPPSLWIQVARTGDVLLSLRDLKKPVADSKISAGLEGVNWEVLQQKIASLKQTYPDLNTAVIRPEAKTNYGLVIRLMDHLKKNQMNDVGLSPLG